MKIDLEHFMEDRESEGLYYDRLYGERFGVYDDDFMNRIIRDEDLLFFNHKLVKGSYPLLLLDSIYQYLSSYKLKFYIKIQAEYMDKFDRFYVRIDHLIIIDKDRKCFHCFFNTKRDFVLFQDIYFEDICDIYNIVISKRTLVDYNDVIRTLLYVVFDTNFLEWKMYPFNLDLYNYVNDYYKNLNVFFDFYKIKKNFYYFRIIDDIKSKYLNYFTFFFYCLLFSNDSDIVCWKLFFFDKINQYCYNLHNYCLDFYYVYVFTFFCEPFVQFKMLEFYFDVKVINYDFFNKYHKKYFLSVENFKFICIFFILFHDFFVVIKKKYPEFDFYPTTLLPLWFPFLHSAFNKYMPLFLIYCLYIDLLNHDLLFDQFRSTFVVNESLDWYTKQRYFIDFYYIVKNVHEYQVINRKSELLEDIDFSRTIKII